MKTIELFAGTKSFSKVAKRRNNETFTIELLSEFKPDLCIDIMELQMSDLPYKPDMIWASPPCTSFSVASMYRHWHKDKDRTPKTETARVGLELMIRTIDLIKEIQPNYWFIENPRGMMRKKIEPYLSGLFYKRETICYCRYGSKVMKPTDIWTNCFEWIPINRMCNNGNPDHERAGRGAKTGVQGIYNNKWEKARGNNEKSRSIIPPLLFEDIFTQIENNFG